MPRVRACRACGQEFCPVGHRTRWCSPVCRLWLNVDRSGGSDACWLWTASLDTRGYGQLRIENKIHRAYRFAWEVLVGPIPDGMHVLHLCESRYPPGDITNRRCCNPAHLHLGTHQDNMRDLAESGRAAAPPLREGDEHWSRRRPDLVTRGHVHYARTSPERLARGEAHGCAKLTESDVAAIRQARAAGAGLPELSATYGLSRSATYAVVTRRTWKHVP